MSSSLDAQMIATPNDATLRQSIHIDITHTMPKTKLPKKTRIFQTAGTTSFSKPWEKGRIMNAVLGEAYERCNIPTFGASRFSSSLA